MKAEFIIFKKGRTTNKVTIKSCIELMPFNRLEKIQKYLSLGYTVYELDGKTKINLKS